MLIALYPIILSVSDFISLTLHFISILLRFYFYGNEGEVHSPFSFFIDKLQQYVKVPSSITFCFITFCSRHKSNPNDVCKSIYEAETKTKGNKFHFGDLYREL